MDVYDGALPFLSGSWWDSWNNKGCTNTPTKSNLVEPIKNCHIMPYHILLSASVIKNLTIFRRFIECTHVFGQTELPKSNLLIYTAGGLHKVIWKPIHCAGWWVFTPGNMMWCLCVRLVTVIEDHPRWSESPSKWAIQNYIWIDLGELQPPQTPKQVQGDPPSHDTSDVSIGPPGASELFVGGRSRLQGPWVRLKSLKRKDFCSAKCSTTWEMDEIL
jgi:hypothetical protein